MRCGTVATCSGYRMRVHALSRWPPDEAHAAEEREQKDLMRGLLDATVARSRNRARARPGSSSVAPALVRPRSSL